jgi:Histidine kinase-, DNA gyrase B-, and HSP90-like ATPase
MSSVLDVSTTSDNAEEFDFEVDVDHLMLDVIKRQAGSLLKAVLEGVMNAIDAGATKCDILTSAGKIIIRDNGSGFKNFRQIKEWFGKWGAVHAASEKKDFGQFRMGRGQLFAYGRNVWRSNQFVIEVDINKLGARKYRLDEVEERVQGCEISIDLYKPLEEYPLGRLIRDLREQTCWVDPAKTEITVNGESTVGTRPTATVAINTPEFTFYTTLAGHDTGVLVYNQGVYIRQYSSSMFGLNGVLNFNLQPEVNFARSDIMDSCPRWQAAQTALHKFGLKDVTAKSRLSAPERTNVCAKLAANVLSADNFEDLPLVRVGTGKAVSLKKLVATRLPVATTDQADPAGDTAHRLHKAFVVTEETLSDFRCNGLDEFLKWVQNKFGLRDDYFKMTNVVEALGDDSKELVLPLEAYTKREQKWLRKLTAAAYLVKDSWHRHSLMQVGVSPLARAWTNGQDYICFDRKYLRSLGWNLDGYQKAVMLLFHEMSHDRPSIGNSIHDFAFYSCYHDMTREYLTPAVNQMKVTN